MRKIKNKKKQIINLPPPLEKARSFLRQGLKNRPPLRAVRKGPIFMVIFLVAVFICLGCGVSFASQGQPENPLGNATSFADEAAVLLYNGEEDETVYVPVPVEAETSSDNSTPTETDEALNDQENADEDENEEQNEPEQPNQNSVQNQQKTVTSKTPSSAEGNSGNNGNGGGTNGNGGSDGVEYFTTSIKDGETLSAADYHFDIYHKIESLKVKETKVFVNGLQIPQFTGNITLKEGQNSVRVEVIYTDAKGAEVGAGKDYTLNLDTKKIVINTSLKNQTVDDDYLSFAALASYLDEEVPLSVTLNGEKLKGNGDKYLAVLKEGENTFVLTASSAGLSAKESYTVIYKNSGEFDIITDLTDQTVDSDKLSFNARLKNGGGGKLTVKVNGTAVNGSDGQYTATLKAGSNTIQMVGVNSSGARVNKSFKVTFERPLANKDNPNPDGETAPRIVTNIEGITALSSSQFTLNVTATDYKGTRIRGDGITVTLNGSVIADQWENETTSYLLSGFLPENTLEILVQDSERHSRLFTYTFTYTKTDAPIGYVTISVEAFTVGLDYLIAPQQVEIYDGDTLSYIVERLLKDNGYSCQNTGTLDNDFYLRGVSKAGLMTNYAIPIELQGYIEESGWSLNGNFDINSLREKDFYTYSGWMYCVNGAYTNYSMAACIPQNGDTIRVRYTLAFGKDIGASNDNYPQEW